MTMKLETTFDGESYVHKTLWTVMLRQMSSAEAQGVGSAYELLAGMVFAFHAFEAYLNYLGFKLAPEIWEKEREFFNEESYKGFYGKVRKVFELCGMEEPSRGKRPYSTIRSLKVLRDTIAHGKVEKIKRTVVHRVDERVPTLSWDLALQVSSKLAARAVADVDQVAKILHEAAKSRLPTEDVWYGDLPFGGVHSYAKHKTTASS